MKGRASMLGSTGREKTDRILGERCPLSSEAGGKEGDGESEGDMRQRVHTHQVWPIQTGGGERTGSMTDRKISLQARTAQQQSHGQLAAYSCGLLQGPLSFQTKFMLFLGWPWPVTEQRAQQFLHFHPRPDSSSSPWWTGRDVRPHCSL